MGQQQLLLLVLASIIVGTGILLGVNMFQENAAQANMDSVTQESLTLATRAQAWYKRPAAMGGGGQSFATVTLAQLGLADPYTTEDGSYTVATGASNTQCTIVGTGKEDLSSPSDGVPLTVTVGVSSNTAAVTGRTL